jgi:UDP-N-acetylmuramate--alanine ligase
LVDSPIIAELLEQGIPVKIGHSPANIPAGTDLVIYSSAAPENNLERQEARRRHIRQLTNFQFLGEWTADKDTILVSGTHGKSTTTAMLGEMLIAGGKDPSVVVGSKVPSFPDGNLRLGESGPFVIEGDEYALHFLEFQPLGLIINNIELDHPDVFPNVEAVMDTFRTLLKQVRDRGVIAANADDPRVLTVIGQERAQLEKRGVKIVTFGFSSHADVTILEYTHRSGEQTFVLRNGHGLVLRLILKIPGKMNVMNAMAAATLAVQLGVSPEKIREALGNFTGIWRRFEKVAEKDGKIVISDYGHHPTAVAANLEACKTFYPGKRIVLCFQPHHRNRTKALFNEFVSSFDKADALILVEVYEVAGRDQATDQDVSSRDLKETVLKRDLNRGLNRPVEYAWTPDEALKLLKRWQKPGDIIIVMGAGDIYQIADQVLE